MSEAQEYGLWSWDYKETKSEATLVLYRHYTVGQKTVPMFGCFAKIEVEQIKKIR